MAKIIIVKSKKLHDKRETIKTRDWNREKNCILRGR
ncbi:SsrA-binding protein [Ehrlichia ruminantium]